MEQNPSSGDDAWRRDLGAAFFSLPGRGSDARVAVLGVGNEMNSDDGVGVYVARALSLRVGTCRERLVLEAGTAPESFGGPLRRFQPHLVLLVDAVQMDAPPGTVAWLAWEQVDGLSASTHTLPLSMVAAYFAREFHCQMALLGIQVASLDWQQALCSAVQQAADEVVDALSRLLAAPSAAAPASV